MFGKPERSGSFRKDVGAAFGTTPVSHTYEMRRTRPWLRLIVCAIFPLVGSFFAWSEWRKVSVLAGTYKAPIGGQVRDVVVETSWTWPRPGVRVTTNLPVDDPARQSIAANAADTDLAVNWVLSAIVAARPRAESALSIRKKQPVVAEAVREAIIQPEPDGSGSDHTWDFPGIAAVGLTVFCVAQFLWLRRLDKRYGSLGPW